MSHRRHFDVKVWALCAGLGLSACAVELQNRQPAKALAQSRLASGSTYTGWRVFQDKCASCHGSDGKGSANAPDLLPPVALMGPRRFLELVLTRYEWDLPAAAQGRSETAPRQALIDQIMQREQGALRMPTWQGEPEVQAHIVDLYAYLAARAQGTQGPGRPTP